MSPFKFSIQDPPTIKALVLRGPKGESGMPGPNAVTEDTDTNLLGPLFGSGGKVRAATAEEVISSDALQAALPAPLAIEEGRVYTVQENQQVAFRFPIAVDGVLRVDGILYEV